MFDTYDQFMAWWITRPEIPRWLLFLLGVFLLFTILPRKRWWRRKRAMGRGHGWRSKFSDLITEAIEIGLDKKAISEKEASRAYRQCADKLQLDDLRPKALTYKASSNKITWLKTQIKRRINGGVDKVTPLPLPDHGPVSYQAPRAKKKLKF